MIRFQGVSKHYGTKKHPIRGISKTDLIISEGEFVAILGPSGAGKTTLLNLMGGMTRPQAGSIRIDGRNILAMDDRTLSEFRATSIGFVFQFPCLLAPLNVLDNVRLPRRFAGEKDDPELAHEQLVRVGLQELGGRMHYELSEGQKRRVCLARALINRPQLLLGDEPTADLDRATENTIMTVLEEENKRGATVVLTTHNTALEERATRILRIEAGTLNSLDD